MDRERLLLTENRSSSHLSCYWSTRGQPLFHSRLLHVSHLSRSVSPRASFYNSTRYPSAYKSVNSKNELRNFCCNYVHKKLNHLQYLHYLFLTIHIFMISYILLKTLLNFNCLFLNNF